MASIKQFIERRNNISAIVAYVREKGYATRMEISSALGLSWACVSELTSLLMNEGVLQEFSSRGEGTVSESRGRPPTCIRLCDDKYFLGVDINDSGIAISILRLDGKAIRSQKWGSEKFDSCDGLSESVCEKIEGMLSDKKNCLGIGVAMEGIFSGDGWLYPFETGVAPYRPEPDIEARFGIPVSARHDPECMLYAAAGDLSCDCMALRVDNGIGVAAMRGGRVLDLPLELGFVKKDGVALRHILRECKKSGDFAPIASALGSASGNLAMLLGVTKVYVVGEIIEWFDEIEDIFRAEFSRIDENIEYEISNISDASVGAARVAMTEYPTFREV